MLERLHWESNYQFISIPQDGSGLDVSPCVAGSVCFETSRPHGYHDWNERHSAFLAISPLDTYAAVRPQQSRRNCLGQSVRIEAFEVDQNCRKNPQKLFLKHNTNLVMPLQRG